jgi:hypothetical protein
MAGFFEHGDEPSGSIRDMECINQLSDYQFLKELYIFELDKALLPVSKVAIPSVFRGKIKI